jgi:hypothetical protein
MPEHSEPMSLGNLRQNGVHSLAVSCWIGAVTRRDQSFQRLEVRLPHR